MGLISAYYWSLALNFLNYVLNCADAGLLLPFMMLLRSLITGLSSDASSGLEES